MKKTIFALILLGLQISAWAASGGGHHDENHIPVSTIAFQALNLGILLVIIFFAVRKSVVAMFKARRENYLEQAQKTEEANKAAELALSDIKNRIQNLKATEQSSIEAAQREAVLLKNKIIEEARAHSEKIKSDAQLVVSAEISNAKSEIRQEIINASLDLAKKNIKSSADSITKKSEKTFLDDISKTKAQVTP